MSTFDLRELEIVKTEKEKMQRETQRLNDILVSLILPAALEDTSGNSLPPSLREKARAMKDKGGLQVVESLIQELPSMLQRNAEILDECQRMLKDEEDSDSELRSTFGDQWSRTPSAKLNEPLKNNLQKYRQVIATASSADQVTREKYSKHQEKIGLMCLPEDQLLSGIPEGSSAASCSSVEKLKGLMRQMDQLKYERENLLHELDSATVDMRAKFMDAREGGVNEQALSVEALGEMYGPLQKRIQDNISRQEVLVRDIQTTNSECSKEKSRKREALMCDLAAAHDVYMELLGHLQEGSKFYQNLTEVLLTFQNKISDFCFARKSEKESIAKTFKRTL